MLMNVDAAVGHLSLMLDDYQVEPASTSPVRWMVIVIAGKKRIYTMSLRDACNMFVPLCVSSKSESQC